MKGGARADSVPAKSAERRDWMDAACDPVIQQYLRATSGTSSCTTSSNVGVPHFTHLEVEPRGLVPSLNMGQQPGGHGW